MAMYREEVEGSLTRDELLTLLRTLAEAGDNPQDDHLEADHALLCYINDPEITQAFTNLFRWYA